MTPTDMAAITWRAALVSIDAIVLEICIMGNPSKLLLLEEQPGSWVEIVDMLGTRGNIRGRLTEATMALLAKRTMQYEVPPRAMTFREAMESESSN